MRPTKGAAACSAGLVLLGAWLWNLAHVPMLANDDAFIFLRYAQNWVDHGSLVWNLGEPGTDGFTSFLYLVAVSAAHALLPGDAAAAAWWTGQLAALATGVLCVVGPFALARRRRARQWGTFVAAALATTSTVALSPQLAYWSHSLMDAPFVAAIVTFASIAAGLLLTARIASRPAWIAAGAGLAALSMTRPEGMLVVVVIAGLGVARLAVGARAVPAPLGWLLVPLDGRARRSLGAALVVLVLLAGGHFVWHLARYGHAFPNPVYVKTAGPSWAATVDGLAYLVAGPAAGDLPTGATRADGVRVPGPRVKAAINPGPRWPSLLVLALWLGLWAASFVSSAWSRGGDARRVRALLLVPTGLLGLVVLSGGDSFYSAWRMVTPVLPAIGWVAAVAVAWLRSPRAALALGLLLAVLAGQKLDLATARPSRCEQSGASCGWASFARWPTTLHDYSWDHSHARQDQQVAAALREALPPDTVVGQSDFLRIAALLPNPVLDLSGLVNAELAHAPHAPSVSVFQPRHLLEAQPDVYFLWWGLVSPRSLARSDLAEEMRNRILLPATRRYPPELAPFFRQLSALYRPASVALQDGRYFNFLIHRRVVERAAGEAIEIGRGPDGGS